MLPIENGGHCGDLFGKQPEVQLGVALFDHATQKSGRVDASLGVVDVAAVAAHATNVTGLAFVGVDELGPQLEVEIGRAHV